MSSRAISPDQGENPIMADTEVKKIICSSCGAEFEDTLPKCPYCGSLNYKGAEAEYLGKLESMRQDMQQLEQVPEKELKKKLKKKQKCVIKLLILLAALAAILAVIVFRAHRSSHPVSPQSALRLVPSEQSRGYPTSLIMAHAWYRRQ